MTNMELLDEAVLVTTKSDAANEITPRRVVWRRQSYSIVGVGRQWDEEEGRHILVEAADGTRFELQLRRDDFTWRLRRVWWGQMIV